jgi:hypothetical protein
MFDLMWDMGMNFKIFGSRAFQGDTKTCCLESKVDGDNINIKIYDMKMVLISEKNLF